MSRRLNYKKQVPPPPPPPKKENFWADPKLWVSILAIVVAGIGIWIANDNNQSQNKKWANLNLARIAVTDADFYTTRLINRKEFYSMKWGYKAQPFTNPQEQDSAIKNVMVKNTVVAIDSFTKEEVLGTSSVTVPEIISELTTKKLFSSRYYLLKRYVVVINFRNMGQTICTCDSVAVSDLSIDSAVGKGPHKLNGDKNVMEYNQNYNCNFVIELPFSKDLPDSFNFKFVVFFRDVNDDRHEKWVRISYSFNHFFISDIN